MFSRLSFFRGTKLASISICSRLDSPAWAIFHQLGDFGINAMAYGFSAKFL